jgi:8-oxo-dGTP pyrophosphatase MutT (NUDIX family)
VLWRPKDGGLEIVLVHRPNYGDWSLPKGKAEPGETDEQTALREVEEETGLVGRLGPELPGTSYRDRFGRPKVVRYWAMPVVSGQLTAQHEVDEACWLPLDVARGMLSYDRDQPVVDALPDAVAG